MAGDDFQPGSLIHLFAADVDLAGHHPVHIFDRLQKSLPGVVLGAHDLGIFSRSSTAAG